MVEIALLGVLVSLVKLSSFLEVTPGAGIWATAGLMVLITLIAHRDIHVLWGMTDEQALFRGAPA
jgi:paraquat-inducible protein A